MCIRDSVGGCTFDVSIIEIGDGVIEVLSTCLLYTSYLPICINGHVEIETAGGRKNVGIHEIHMEEDAGKPVSYTHLETAQREHLPHEDFVKFVLVGEMALASEKDLDYLNQWIQDDYYTVKVTDKTKIRIDYEDYRNDASLRGEFVRLVQADEVPVSYTHLDVFLNIFILQDRTVMWMA